MRYAVKYPFRDRDGVERVPGDIMEIDDATRASSLQRRRLIGKALKEIKKPEPEPSEPALGEAPEAESAAPQPKTKGKKAAGKAVKGGEVDELA